jgi:hypothetical protein
MSESYNNQTEATAKDYLEYVREEALGYWINGLQYLDLVEAVIAETIIQWNARFVVSDQPIGCDQYERETR